MSLSSYLVRRGNTYYYRARTPADIAVATGRSQVVVSLRTTELRKAKLTAARVFFSLASVHEKIRAMAEEKISGKIDGLTRAQSMALAAFELGREYQIERTRLRAEFDDRFRLLAASISDDEPDLALPLEGLLDAKYVHWPKPINATGPFDPAQPRVDPVMAAPPYSAQLEHDPLALTSVPSVQQNHLTPWPTLKSEFYADKPGLATKTKWSYNQAFNRLLKNPLRCGF